MRFNKPHVSLLSAAIVMTFALVVAAQERAPETSAATEIVEGTLTDVDTDVQVFGVQTADGQIMEFHFDDDTNVTGGGGTVAGLVGLQAAPVRVTFDPESEDVPIPGRPEVHQALSIEIATDVAVDDDEPDDDDLNDAEPDDER